MRHNKSGYNMRLNLTKLAVMVLICIIALTAVFVPVEVNAASKRAKYSYSVKVTNINSNTVLKKGTRIKVAYKAKKKRNGKISNTRVRFKSSNKKVASISKKGVIKAKKKGTTYITVYCRFKPSKKKRIKVRVGTPVSSINVSGYNYIRKGRTTYFKAETNSKATNKGLSWKSDNTAVATVNSSGMVTAKGAGTATIYAEAKDGSKVRGARKVYVHQYTKGDARWIAHRGLHTSATENTDAAFEAAGKAGFWGCECDVWETARVTPDMPEVPDIIDGAGEVATPDVSHLIDGIIKLPETDSLDILDKSAEVERLWDVYISLTDGLDSGELTAVHAAMLDEQTGEDYLLKLFDAYKYVKEYESMRIVINHDATFKRTMKDKRSVRSMTADEICEELPKVCFLDEYLDICEENDMVPVIEFKDENMSSDAVKKAVDIIADKGMLGNAYLISFHHLVLADVKAYSEEILKDQQPITYYLFNSKWEAELDVAHRYGFTGVSIPKGLLTDELYAKAKAFGFGVGTWTYYNTAEDDNNLYNHVVLNNNKLDFATVDYKVF